MNKTEVMTAADYQSMIRGKTSGHSGKKRAVKSSTPEIISNLYLYFTRKGVLCVKEYAFHPTRKWRFDLAFPEKKIAVEYEGIFSEKSRHTTVGGYSEDCNKYNEATVLGWKVIRITAKSKDVTSMLEKALSVEKS